MTSTRAEELFLQHSDAIHRRTDRLFAWLMGMEWLGAIIAALYVSPLTWSGAEASTHVHVWAAIVLGGAIVSLPIALAVWSPGRETTRQVIAVAQMLMSALLIHLTGGRIETHFHVFGSLAFLAFYRDWRVLASASAVVAVDHFLRGLYWPESVYGVVIAGEWRWLEHVFWVVFEDVILVMAITQSIREMKAIAARQANLEEDIQYRQQMEEAHARLLEKEQAARREAERANKAKDDFLATLSHELRTPLTSMFGWVGILGRGEVKPETMQHGLKVLHRNVRTQAQLIEDLLDVSRIVAGKFHIEMKPMLLNSVLQQAVESARPAAAARGVELTYSGISADHTAVTGDAQRLHQVISNLLSNAIKFTPAEGRVSLKVVYTDTHVRFAVTDTGRGIKPDFLPHMFERFRQADSSTTRHQGGLGLGLAIVRHIVEHHGGTVTAASEGEGRGAQFDVCLPRLKNAVVLKDNRPSGAVVAARPGMLDGLSVLVVEDENDTLELISMVLERSGAKVFAASSATEAMRVIEHHAPDVMISDIGMPGEDGYSLIRSVRAREAKSGRHVPAAALTAYAKHEDREAALAAGFEDHVAKPIVPEKLPLLVAELARRRSPSGLSNSI